MFLSTVVLVLVVLAVLARRAIRLRQIYRTITFDETPRSRAIGYKHNAYNVVFSRLWFIKTLHIALRSWVRCSVIFVLVFGWFSVRDYFNEGIPPEYLWIAKVSAIWLAIILAFAVVASTLLRTSRRYLRPTPDGVSYRQFDDITVEIVAWVTGLLILALMNLV